MSVNNNYATKSTDLDLLRLKNGEGPISGLPLEMICTILTQVPLASDRNTACVCRLWNALVKQLPDPTLKVYGKEEWKTFYGFEVQGSIPPFPANITQYARGFRKRFEGKKMAPRCSLVLMPQGLTLCKLRSMVNCPKRGNKTGFSAYSGTDVFARFGDQNIGKSYWVLMTEEVIEGSCIKSAEQQLEFVRKKGGAECEFPRLLEGSALCFMHYADSGERLFPYEWGSFTYTRCQELIGEHIVAFGFYTDSGLFLTNGHPDVLANHLGVAACLRFM